MLENLFLKAYKDFKVPTTITITRKISLCEGIDYKTSLKNKKKLIYHPINSDQKVVAKSQLK